MDVLFVVLGDETRASTRYRVLNLLPALDDTDIEYDYLSVAELADSFRGPDLLAYILVPLLLLVRAHRYDAVFLQKVPLPGPYVRLLKRRCETIIYDFDDAIYATPQWSESPAPWKPLLEQTLSHSTVVITGSPVLSEYAERFCDRTECLPTSIPKDEYVTVQEDRGGTSESGVTLGWIGNPQNLHYLASITDPLEEVLDVYPEVTLHIITAGELPVTPLADREDVIYKEWSLESELELLGEADIGIRPLFDDEWTRGKGGYTSVVQTMALGIPVVVTPIEMLSDIVEHGVSGYHADSDDEWIEYLNTLIRDHSKREQMGAKAFERVGELGFWEEQRAEEFVNVFTTHVS